MKSTLSTILALTFVSSMASAHLTIGTYRGTDTEGKECSFDVSAVNFEDNIKHPLNERVVVRADDMGFVLRHAPTVDVTRSTVTFEKDRLTGVKGTAAHTWAFALTMVHDEKTDGPSDFTLIKQDNKVASKTEKYFCKDLVAP